MMYILLIQKSSQNCPWPRFRDRPLFAHTPSGASLFIGDPHHSHCANSNCKMCSLADDLGVEVIPWQWISTLGTVRRWLIPFQVLKEPYDRPYFVSDVLNKGTERKGWVRGNKVWDMQLHPQRGSHWSPHQKRNGYTNWRHARKGEERDRLLTRGWTSKTVR